MDKFLEQLAEQLNTTVPYLWDMLVQQAVYGGISNLVFALLLMVLCGVAVTLTIKLTRVLQDEMDRFLIMMIVIALASLIFIVSLISIPDSVNRIVNPEYWALKQILDVIDND